MPRARGPWVGRARGRGRRISLEAAGPAPPGEGLPVRQGTQIQLVVSADTWPVCAGIFAQTTAPKVIRPSTHACPRGEGREGQRVPLEWKHLSSCPSSGPKGTVWEWDQRPCARTPPLLTVDVSLRSEGSGACLLLSYLPLAQTLPLCFCWVCEGLSGPLGPRRLCPPSSRCSPCCVPRFKSRLSDPRAHPSTPTAPAPPKWSVMSREGALETALELEGTEEMG